MSVQIKVFLRRDDASWDCKGKLHITNDQWFHWMKPALKLAFGKSLELDEESAHEARLNHNH